MKNIFNFLGFTALVAVIMLSMTACNKNKAPASAEQNAPDAENNGDGSQIRLSNVPVTGASSSYDFGYTATGLGVIEPLSDLFTGAPKAEVNNGRLTLELDAPKSGLDLMQPLIYMFYNDISATPGDANGYRPSFQTSNVFSTSTNSYSLDIKGPDQGKGVNGAFLLYVDKDVTVNGSNNSYNFDSIFLTKGWNFITYTYNSNGTNYIKTASQTLPAGYVWTVRDDGIFKPPNDDIGAPAIDDHDYDKILKGDLSDFARRWENSKGESRTLRADGTFADGQIAGGFTTQTMANGGIYYMWGVHTPDGGGFGVMLFPIGTGILFGNEFYETDKGRVRIMMGQDFDIADLFY